MQNIFNDIEFEPSDYFQCVKMIVHLKKWLLECAILRVWRKGIKEIKKGKDHKSIPIV